MEQFLPEPAVGVGQLEGPKEVVSLLERRADRVDLVDQVLHTDNTLGPQSTLDHGVVRDGDALLVDLRVALSSSINVKTCGRGMGWVK